MVAAGNSIGPGQSRETTPFSAYDALSEKVLTAPSLFARLQNVAALLHSASGQYRHPLSRHFGSEEVDHALRCIHGEVFRAWLGLPLRRQASDLAIYRASLRQDVPIRELTQKWIKLVPPHAHRAECQLFLADLTVLAELEL